MEEIVYLNGSLISRSQARISPFDHGFLYGYGLFETMRALHGRIFRLEQHLARLRHSADIIGLGPKLAHLDLERICLETLKANSLEDASLRMAVSMGVGEPRPDPSTCGEATVFVVARRYTPYPEETYERGWRALASTHRRDSGTLLSRLKSANFLTSVLARQEAKAAGYDEALLTNEKGFLVEGSTSNLFFVQGGVLFTPPEGSGILPGIARGAVLELASAQGLRVREKGLRVRELGTVDELFLTNVLVQVMPIVEVEGRPVGSGRPGKVTHALRASFMELVEQETRCR